MRTTVLYGGPSAEREVSLVSGKAVASGLRQAGHDVFEFDVRPETLDQALARPCDVVFPVLHGEWGEDGKLQAVLEARRIPFVGSGSKASHLGMNKLETKRAWEAAGLPTPRYKVLARNAPLNGFMSLGLPLVVKAVDSGSSVDVYIADTEDKARTCIGDVLSRHASVLLEQYIKGPELTVGLLEEKALAPLRIVAKVAFFDYEAKYKRNDTEHRFDTGLSPELVETCKRMAEQANAIVGARDLARVDIMIDERTNQPHLLEINTLPGFTPKSLLPEAAAHAGVPFAQLVDRLARRAAARKV